MSANPSRFDSSATAPESSSPLQQGNRVLESITRQESLRSLLAFSDLREQIRNRRTASGDASVRDLFETERFILDEVLQLICDRILDITRADGIVVALAEGPNMVCRATGGALAVARGAHLGESVFLLDCLGSGQILRCNACETDARVELDIAPRIGARSTLMVPLRGRREQIGILQVFSATEYAFTDHDVRCLDLFSELVLSALKPVDQDRRIGWLSDIAGEVLQTKPATTVADDAGVSANQTPVGMGLASSLRPTTSVQALPSNAAEDSSDIFDDAAPQSLQPSDTFSRPGSSRPGLSVVLSLVVVAAMFSAVAWWGMRAHDTPPRARMAKAKVANTMPAMTPQPAITPSAPPGPTDVLSLEISDNLMSDSPNDSEGAALTAATENKGVSKITGLRHWSSPVGSTVVIDMEGEVPYEVHRLSSPERIYFDLHGTALPTELNEKTMDIGDVSLSRVRIGKPIAGVTRIVLDTKDGANFSVSMESSPYRLVVELRGSGNTLGANRTAPQEIVTNPTSPTAARPPARANGTPAVGLALKTSGQTLAARTEKNRIVLDAGHGGWDLGTVGRKGLLEKDLVLDVTQRLGKLLQARLGSEVLFTRTDDTYLPLDQRADVANQGQADLFVSVHANYSTSAASRGVETYYTNLFSAPGSREVEKHDDGTFTKPATVSLSPAGLHEKIEESRRLAASVQRSLYATLAPNSPDIRNRGIKDAAFAVLIGTTMPAILTEISFVSSPEDEHKLRSAAYRQQIAEALYHGIARYQQSSVHAKVAQLQTNAASR